MDNNNLSNNENQNGEQGQFQQPYQQQPYQQQQFYQQQSYQQQQPFQSGDSGLEEPVSFADWMVTMLLMFIPCVNIIMMFVWAFGSGTKQSKSNYCKAMLVWTAISIVLSIAFLASFGAMFASIMESGMYY